MPTTPEPRRERRTVPPDRDGERLDRFLAETTDLSRSAIRRLILEGWVRIDGRQEKPGHSLTPGAVIELEVPPPAPSHIEPQNIPLDILFEDEDVIVLNKPPGLVVHPGAGNPDRTLVNALVHHCGEIEGVGGVRRPGIVHRLDKDTSGVMIAAKTDRAHAKLVEDLQRREITRIYRALVWGAPKDHGVVEAPIGRDPRNRKRMAVPPRGGRPATTEYRVLGWFDFISFVELTLQTGRTHQIRVHMSHVGHPVLGDPVYGGRTRRLVRLPAEPRGRLREALARFPRQALHAWCLEFLHPVSGLGLRFEAPLPPDFGVLLESVGGGSHRYPSSGRWNEDQP